MNTKATEELKKIAAELKALNERMHALKFNDNELMAEEALDKVTGLFTSVSKAAHTADKVAWWFDVRPLPKCSKCGEPDSRFGGMCRKCSLHAMINTQQEG